VRFALHAQQPIPVARAELPLAQQKTAAQARDRHLVQYRCLRDHRGEQVGAFLDFVRADHVAEIEHLVERKAAEHLVQRQKILWRRLVAGGDVLQQASRPMRGGLVPEPLFAQEPEPAEKTLQERPEDDQTGVVDVNRVGVAEGTIYSRGAFRRARRLLPCRVQRVLQYPADYRGGSYGNSRRCRWKPLESVRARADSLAGVTSQVSSRLPPVARQRASMTSRVQGGTDTLASASTRCSSAISER
jgi:hypothetical protein